jgi:hypothetical protein
MEAPIVIDDAQREQRVDVDEPIRCALVVKPSEAARHKTDMLRYFVLVIALLAVLLLIAIAFYYTKGNVVTIRHVSSLVPQFSLPSLS